MKNRERNRLNELWKAMAGDSLADLLKNRESTEKALCDMDPNLRKVAISLLCSHWSRQPELRSQIEKMANEDADLGVRGVAIVHLGVICRGTNDKELGVKLANIVRNEHQPARLRSSAYSALINLRALPFLSPIATLFYENQNKEFPAGCDWEFVDSFFAK